MTNPWTAFKADGSGRMAVRLAIAGVPTEAVTDASMEVHGSAGVAHRVSGLLLGGITIEERIDMARAECDASPFTATFVERPTTWDASLAWTALFSKRPTLRCWVAATCTEVATSITVTTTDGFPASGVIYVDQEAIVYTSITGTTFDGCTRGAYGSLATYHYSLATTGTRAAEVTDWPLSMEGRHVRVFAYAEQDTPTGDGTQVWLGIVSRDARLGADQCSWELGVDPITRVFDGPLGGDLTADMPARGVYYAWDCCFNIVCYVSTDSTKGNIPSAPTWTIQITGFYETQDDFAAYVRSQIDANATTPATGLGLSCVSDGASGFHFELVTGAGANNRWVGLYATSPIDNVHQGGVNSIALLGADGATADMTTISTGTVASTRYVYQQLPGPRIPSGTSAGQTHTDAVDEPGAVPRGSFASTWTVIPDAPGTRGRRAFQKPSAQSTAPQNVIYLGGFSDLTGIGAVTVDLGGGSSGDGASGSKITMAVTPTAATRLLTAPSDSTPSAQSVTFAGLRAPRITPTRSYVSGGTLHDLRGAILGAVVQGAPVGTAPYLYDAALLGTPTSDFGTWDAVSTAAIGSIAQRTITSARALKLGDLVREEAKNVGCFFALDSQGRIEVYQIGVAPTTVTPWVVTVTNELSEEAAATWERNASGSIAQVVVKTGYDPINDSWAGPTYIFNDVTCRGRNPSAAALTIAPKSQQTVFGFGPTLYETSAYGAIASGIFAIYGYPYDVITVSVPFTLFDARCGDTIQITTKNLPGTGGDRGMSARNGIIIGRRWNLAEGVGSLTVLSSEVNYAGYTPTARVSSQVDNGGNNWTLTIATPAAGPTIGYSLATAFAVNDLVRVARWDSTTSTIVTGTVSAVTATTVRVQFTGVWTPGGSTWNLEYGLSSAPWQTSQQAYCAVADTTDRITYSATTHARQFAP